MPKGAIVGYEQFIGTSGKAYKVPLLADGKGNDTRWMADVPWAELSLNLRITFAMRGGGHFDAKDIYEIIENFGDDSAQALLPKKE